MGSEAILSYACKMTVSGTPAYYNIIFDVPRFVHAVTLVGNPAHDFGESKNWFVTLGSNTGPSIIQNTIYG